jgi:hypothetical protein
MRTALPICVLLAVCAALPVSASAKQHRSASAKRDFHLTHPQTCSGRRGLTRRPRTSGRRRDALGRVCLSPLSHYPPSRRRISLPSLDPPETPKFPRHKVSDGWIRGRLPPATPINPRHSLAGRGDRAGKLPLGALGFLFVYRLLPVCSHQVLPSQRRRYHTLKVFAA